MNLLYKNPLHFLWTILGACAPAWGLTLLGIYGIKTYGLFIFVALPTLIGYGAAQIWRWREKTATRWDGCTAAVMALLFYAVGLLCFAVEGIICLLMSAPLAIPLAMLGAILADVWKRKNVVTMGFPLLLIPGAILTDGTLPAGERTYVVESDIVIAAPPESVWKKVVAFSAIPEPTEPLFKAGVAYPTHATIHGEGVGAIRECHFSTGTFVEPITRWEEPHTLEFAVERQPIPMFEMSPWDIHPPHLDGWFSSTRGRFVLEPLEGGQTRLVGTTWYHNRLRPEPYWNLWINPIVHAIHMRVLRHIKADVEGT